MNKDVSLTDGERLFRLRETKNRVTTRLIEIDTWLATAGKACATKQDRRIRHQFVDEKMGLQAQIRMVTQQIRELTNRIQEREVRSMLRGSAVPPADGKKVTDHALVRWLERKHGIDVEEMREALYLEAQDSVERGRTMQGDGVSGRTGVRTTTGDMVYVIDPATKIVVTCYRLGEADVLNK